MATYYIYTLQDLQDIANGHLTDDCVLMNDIDASATRTWNDGAGFLPIRGSYGFKGTFDGQGYSIFNLYINRPSSNYVELFGELDCNGNKFVKDLKLINVEILGYRYVGGLCGVSNESLIEDVVVTGKVAAVSDNCGGLIGNYGYGSGKCSGIIQRCFVDVDVGGNSGSFGLMVGEVYVHSIMVVYCCAFGTVYRCADTSSAFVGTLLYGGKARVKRCYINGKVLSGDLFLGGHEKFYFLATSSFYNSELGTSSYGTDKTAS